MCNPKPLKRCMADSYSALQKKMGELNSKAAALSRYPDNKDNFSTKELNSYLKDQNDFAMLQREVEKSKVFMYASNMAQAKPAEAVEKVNALNSHLHPLAQKNLLSDENSLYRTGQYLNKLQGHAEAYDKSLGERDDDTQLKVARAMYNKGFKSAHDAMKQKLKNDRDQKIGAILDRTESDEPNLETDEVEETYNRNVERLEDAYEYARRDAHDVVSKDMKANYGAYFNPMMGMNTEYKKNVDGSFTVTTEFAVNEKKYGAAVEQIEQSFNLEEIQITTSPNDDGSGGYNAKASYIFNGGEKLDDAKKFHQDTAFAGTPHWRESLADIKRVSQLPPIRK